jgi:anthranilate phosphoribosyltransferase
MENVTRECIKRLYENQELTGKQISDCMREIMTGTATHSQIGAFLMLLQGRPLNADILLFSASSLLSLSLPFEWSKDSVDIVGTGTLSFLQNSQL